MKINVRYPNLNGKSYKQVARSNEMKLIKSVNNLIVEEKNAPKVMKQIKQTPAKKMYDGGRMAVKKPKTFAL